MVLAHFWLVCVGCEVAGVFHGLIDRLKSSENDMQAVLPRSVKLRDF